MKNLEPISRKFKTSLGMEIAVDLWGPPSEKSVLLLHGGGQTRHSWGSTAKRLVSVGAHAVTLDLRGHGNSNWSRESEYELGHFSQDIAVILEKLRLRPALVGASLGGLVGMFLEGRLRPNSVSSLVLVDIVPNMNVGGAERVKDFMLKHAKTGFSSLEEIAYVPIEEMVQIEAFDEETVNELRSRASAVILTAAIAKEEKVSEPADDLLGMDGMDSDTAKLLASKNIITMEDLAELAVDELIELVKMDEERAKALIMTARAPWFV